MASLNAGQNTKKTKIVFVNLQQSGAGFALFVVKIAKTAYSTASEVLTFCNESA